MHGWSLDDVLIDEDLREDLRRVLLLVRSADQLATLLGPRVADPGQQLLNLHGPSGTGKSFVAEVIAGELGRPLVRLEAGAALAKGWGDTEANLRAAFRALPDGAILFIDEADSVLSRRVSAETSNGAALNGIRNEILRLLNEFEGTVIAATNLVGQYDAALGRRFINVHVPAPERPLRVQLWRWLAETSTLAEDLPADWPEQLEDVLEEEEVGTAEAPFTVADMKRVLQLAGTDVLLEDEPVAYLWLEEGEAPLEEVLPVLGWKALEAGLRRHLEHRAALDGDPVAPAAAPLTDALLEFLLGTNESLARGLRRRLDQLEGTRPAPEAKTATYRAGAERTMTEQAQAVRHAAGQLDAVGRRVRSLTGGNATSLDVAAVLAWLREQQAGVDPAEAEAS